ncbi:MAG: 2-dehydropantoate 2-reductase [Nitrospinae bacterium]|nr:2-dehydropantoate 2-reductase [Nitrospinota bacterium]
MQILLYGAGAVGLGLASCLLKSGEQVDLIGRKDTVDALQHNGLQRTGLFGDFQAPPASFGAYVSLRELPKTHYNFILVCTKSFDTRTAAQQIAGIPFLNNASGPIVLCQNGWGNAEIFAEHFPKERIKSGRVITGFRRPHKHQVDITVHADPIHLGSLFDDDVSGLEKLSAAIDAGGIPCAVTPTVSRDLWAKMLYNCMLNGWSTVFDVPYGVLGESSHTRELMAAIAHEVYAVMTAAGYDTHWASAGDYIDTFYKHQLPPTTSHEPSMLQDIRAGKRTEIDALNGAVVTLGKQHDVPVPANTTLTRMIQFMESRPIK